MNNEKIISVRKQVGERYGSFLIPKISYILLFSPRSGSNLITTQLQSISFGNPFEAFHYNQKRLNQRYGWKIDTSDPFGYFHQAYNTLTVNEIFGLKITWKQYKTFIRILREIVGKDAEDLNDFEVIEVFFPNTKYMYLKRRNKIRQAISFSKGMQTGIWKATPEQLNIQKDYIIPPRYDRLHIECCLDELLVYDEGWEQFLASFQGEYLKIWYEEIADDFTVEMLKIYDYLGVEKDIEKPKPIIKKLANKQSEDWYNIFIKETNWLENNLLREALFTGDTRFALTLRAGQIFQERGEARWRKMPMNRFKKLKYYLFRLKKKLRKSF